ncbi:hypothetical protein RFI_37561, partial [Reticulomyxa filosa]
MVKHVKHYRVHVLKPLKEMKKNSMSCSINCHNTEENMCFLVLIVIWKRQEHIKYACNCIPKHWDLQIEILLLGYTINTYQYNWNRNDVHAQYTHLLEFEHPIIKKQITHCPMPAIWCVLQKHKTSEDNLFWKSSALIMVSLVINVHSSLQAVFRFSLQLKKTTMYHKKNDKERLHKGIHCSVDTVVNSEPIKRQTALDE